MGGGVLCAWDKYVCVYVWEGCVFFLCVCVLGMYACGCVCVWEGMMLTWECLQVSRGEDASIEIKILAIGNCIKCDIHVHTHKPYTCV